jgi:hypothetical protein
MHATRRTTSRTAESSTSLIVLLLYVVSYYLCFSFPISRSVSMLILDCRPKEPSKVLQPSTTGGIRQNKIYLNSILLCCFAVLDELSLIVYQLQLDFKSRGGFYDRIHFPTDLFLPCGRQRMGRSRAGVNICTL